jgi:hypothetical protein
LVLWFWGEQKEGVEGNKNKRRKRRAIAIITKRAKFFYSNW